MTIYVKDPATSSAVRELAQLRGVSLTEAVRHAVESALRAERRKTLPQRLDAIARSGKEADKAFYDSLSGED